MKLKQITNETGHYYLCQRGEFEATYRVEELKQNDLTNIFIGSHYLVNDEQGIEFLKTNREMLIELRENDYDAFDELLEEYNIFDYLNYVSDDSYITRSEVEKGYAFDENFNQLSIESIETNDEFDDFIYVEFYEKWNLVAYEIVKEVKKVKDGVYYDEEYNEYFTVNNKGGLEYLDNEEFETDDE